MKYISKIAFAIILSLTFFACSEDDNKLEETQLVDNSETIAKLINSFDLVVKQSVANPKLSDEKLDELFIEESKRSGLNILETNVENISAKSNSNDLTFSNEYQTFSNEIENADNFSTKEEFKNNLTDLNTRVLNSDILIAEKQLLIDNIGFMIAFVDWMGTLENNQSAKSSLEFKCDGWWSCWGKCTSAVIGGGLTGGLGGCGIGAAAGLGILSIPGCGVGAIIGGIGGALTGAAAVC
tara:strand:+ start:237 stop:953 length:717 start_codon:yes stop_codon:yes gene_type:complete